MEWQSATPTSNCVRVVDLLERNANLFGQRQAVIIANKQQSSALEVTELTFEQLRNRVLHIAAGLQALGVGSGQRLALLADNDLVYFDVYLAACYLGAAAVPLSTQWTVYELQAVLSDIKPTTTVVDDKHAAKLQGLANCGQVLPTNSAAYADLCTHTTSLDLLLTGLDNSRPDDTALILYTSGTTSQPKGVCLSQQALAFNGITMALAQRFLPDDVVLSTTPLYHTAAGTRVCSMLADGQTHVVLQDFSPEAFFAVVAKHRVNVAVVVPTQLHRILEHPHLAAAQLESLRLIVYGGGAAPATLIKKAQSQLRCELYQAYGLTECVTHLTGLDAHDHQLGLSVQPQLLKSCGRAVLGVRIQIRSTEGLTVPVGQVGEIWVQTPKMMSRYWNKPTLSTQTLVDGWLRTGDLGHLDCNGYLYVAGRIDEMFKSGGVNIYPSQIEAVLRDHRAISDVAVVGRPDTKWGERPVAYLELTNNQDIQAILAELPQWCGERLSKPQVPDEFIVLQHLPRTSTNKIQKHKLHKLL